jgi:hypothetical protein
VNIDIGPLLLVIFGGGLIAGIAAYRKSGKEADNQQAQAAANMIAAADDVVTLVRAEMTNQLLEMNDRIGSLEATVHAWDGWADRVIDLLDRTFGMLTDKQKEMLHPDIMQAKETRPPRYRHYHDKLGKSHDGQKPKGEEET